ncbi:MAG: SpoIID/LytB domain-containing protein [Acidobacteriota bacterium]
MLSQRSFLYYKRSLAFALVGLLVTGLTFNNLTLAQNSKNRTSATINKSATSSTTRTSATNSYGASGPLVRIALVTDVASVALSSATGLAIRANSSDKKVFANGQILAEIHQPTKPDTIAQASDDAPLKPPTSTTITATGSAYHVEITSASDLAKAKRITENVKTRYDQTAKYSYDGQNGTYKIITGNYKSKVQALDMLAVLREAGYGKARLVAIQNNAAKNTSSTKPVTYKAQPASKDVAKPAAPNSRPAILTTQIAAFSASKMIAASDKTLIISAEASDIEAGDDQENRSYRTAKTAASSTGKPLTIRVSGKDYRGDIHLKLNERGRINVINVLPMEDYLRGVVPVELSPSIAQIEALKAQAVAARSYALATLGRFKDEGFDLRDDQRSQVYGGYSVEHPTTNRAVEETRGVVALTFNESGKGSAIEALYTADCGGKTENSENIFSGRAIGYLRSVDCAMDKDLTQSRELASVAKFEQLNEPFGHSLSRDVALLAVLGFNLPNKVSKDYLDDAVDRSELQTWAERAAKLTREIAPRDSRRDSSSRDETNAFDIHHEMALLRSNKRDITKLPSFATLIALATYGENRESLFMSQSETDYLLAGLGGEEVSREMRADLALLIKDNILRLPGSGQINTRSSITRAHALETFARAIRFKSQTGTINLQSATAVIAKNNVLTIVAARNAIARTPSVTMASARPSRTANGQQDVEIEKDARLFKVFGDHSYAVERLGIIGGERLTYHLNASGRIDFLEVDGAHRDVAREQVADASKWQESLSPDDTARRLTRARIDVGDIETITPLKYGASGRVVELEIVGSNKTLQLRGQQIRTAFGLKENPLMIERERNAQGEITNFIFTGKGWGHGVGMCQIGAARLAKQGQSYIGILQKYYAGVSVQKIY